MLGHLVSNLPPTETGGFLAWLRHLLTRLRIR